jgi:polyisoprenoid-binding protein YceI
MGTTSYVVDVKSSQLTVQAFAEGLAGIADHRPRFSVRVFSGELEFGPDKLDRSSLNLTAQAGSLEIMDEVTQHDRRAVEQVMFGEVLHPQMFPEVTFRSSRAACSALGSNRYLADVTGMVSLHGEENQQSIQAQLIISNDSLRAYGEFRLRQTDYGITIASVAGGMIRIKDEVKFVFFLVARKPNGI